VVAQRGDHGTQHREAALEVRRLYVAVRLEALLHRHPYA
jgi:hypothetical protein